MSDVPMLEQWMRDTEGENLEFKSARNNFHFDELTQYRQSPRNRRVAEIFALCGLVERAGQGVDLMYCDAIRQSKLRPDFTRSDQYTVSVLLAGRIRNTAFIRFLKQFE
ncbi:MAG TPA: ATP-binding protein, partial [Planctomycetaceae bacterium]|nr:ATP-binding protein [Planctomycetaceae bacterium]